VQTAAREKRRSDLRGPVHLPRMLQQQEFQVRLGTARLAAACCQRRAGATLAPVPRMLLRRRTRVLLQVCAQPRSCLFADSTSSAATGAHAAR
jgi:hypothetical protein